METNATAPDRIRSGRVGLWSTSRSYRSRVALIAGIGIQLGLHSVFAGTVAASPPSGYGDTDGGSGGFGGSSNDSGFGNDTNIGSVFGNDDNDSNDKVYTPASSATKAAAPTVDPAPVERLSHSYDEAGTNVLRPDDDGFVTVLGTDGDDVVVVNDTLYNRQITVNDRLYYAPTTPGVGVVINGSNGDDSIIGSFEPDRLYGGGGDDVLFGGLGADLIVGGEGNDEVHGESGSDSLFGNAGDDLIFPGSGSDEANGGSGDDTIDETRHNSGWWMFAGADTLHGGTGDDILRGGAWRDTLTGGAGDDTLEGGASKDTLSGNDGDDVLYGGPGNDVLNGNVGNDYLDGGEGGDWVRGFAGDDIVSGGRGGDIVDGGTGNDVLIPGPSVDWVIASREVDESDRDSSQVETGSNVTDEGVDTIYSERMDRVDMSANDLWVDVAVDHDLAEDQIQVVSDDSNFVDRVNSDLVTVRSTPAGKALLTEIEEADKKVRIYEAEDPRDASFVTEIPGQPLLERYLRPDGSPGSGVETDIAYGTAKPRASSAADVPVVHFVHDLVHARNNARGVADRGFSVEVDSDGNPLTDPSTGKVVFTADSELQATGIPYDQDGNQDSVNPSMPEDLEPNTMPVTENAFRADLRVEERKNYRTTSAPLVTAEESSLSRYEDDGGTEIEPEVEEIGASSDVEHSYDEVGTNLLLTNNGAAFIGRGTSGDDVIEVVDNAYHRQFILNDNVYIVPRQAGQGINVIGGAGNDTIRGTDFSDVVFGGAGDDTLYGNGESDRLSGGLGNDTIYGGEGRDEIIGASGNDQLFGGGDNDLLSGDDGDDVVHGGPGDDIVLGNAGSDELFGGAGRDRIHPGAGDDVADGGDGDDLLDETFVVDSEPVGGNDTLRGGRGNDVLRSGIGGDKAFGGAGSDYINGGPGDDTILGGGGNDVIYASVGDDVVEGNDGSDYLDGGTGDDTINGNAGPDVLSGGFGADTLNGDDGEDVVVTGPGNDAVVDADSEPDRTFAEASDRVDLSANDELVEMVIDEDLIRSTIGIATNDWRFADRVGADLTTLGSFSSGQDLLNAIDEHGNDVTIYEIQQSNMPSYIVEPKGADATDGMLRPDGTPGPGLDTIIVYNPVLRASRFADAIPLTDLSHELIHAEQFGRGVGDPGYSAELDENGDALIHEPTGEIVYSKDLELQAVGADYDQDGNQDEEWGATDPTLSSADELEPNTMPITEASIRADLGMQPRSNYSTIPIAPGARPGVLGQSSADPEVDELEIKLVEPADRSLPEVETSIEDSPNSIRSSGACVDGGGDGSGGGSGQSCAEPTSSSRHPTCQGGAESDSDGDGFGWENHRTCVM